MSDDRTSNRQPTPSGTELNELAWMTGYWTADQDATRAEEVWLAPRGRLMLGLHRDVTGDTRTFFEYLRIEERDDACVYVASPRGKSATEFRLVEMGSGRAVFENPVHDFPQRIIYWREGETLHARIENVNVGEDRTMQWTWHRAPWGENR